MNRIPTNLIILMSAYTSTISSAQQIERLGSAVFGGSFRSIEIVNNYAHCSTQGGFVTLDISDPDNITFLGGTSLIYHAGGLIVDGDYAYVTMWMVDTMTFAIIDISDPDRPQVTATLNDTGGGPMAKSGNYVFITGSYAGMKIIDVSNPFDPTVQGTYPVEAEIRDIYISGSYVYLACTYQGIQIIDISNPVDPVYVTTYQSPIGNWVISVTIRDSYAYVGGMRFEILDISDPAEPVYIGGFEPDFDIRKIRVKNNYAYGIINDGFEMDHLVVVNIEDLENPFQVDELLVGYYSDLEIIGDRMYISGKDIAVMILDVSIPDSPVVIGEMGALSYLNRIVVSGNYAFNSCLQGGAFGIVDITDYHLPRIVGYGNTHNNAHDVDVDGNFLFVGAADLEIYDIALPEAPVQVATLELPGNVYFVEIKGRYAYVPGLRVVDISDPANPFLAGECPGVGGYGISIQEDVAYISNRIHGLCIVDISDPTNPILLGSYAAPDFARDVHVQGDYAYLALESNGLEVVNVSDPYNPYPVGSYDTPDYAGGVFIQGDYAYVADQDAGLIILDISEPSNPALVTTYPSTSETNGCFVVGEHIFLADRYSVVILRFDAESGNIEIIGRLPGEYSLLQNIPNPFNPSTTISYSLPEQGELTISIYNLLGQRVATLLDGFQQAGQHSLTWDASAFPSGVYFARLEAGGRSETVKMVLLK